MAHEYEIVVNRKTLELLALACEYTSDTAGNWVSATERKVLALAAEAFDEALENDKNSEITIKENDNGNK